MIIRELTIKGYKSFPNYEQTIKFDQDQGKLILLCGVNGSGKSSLLECVEWSLYGKVKSMKNKKWTKTSLLSNRINQEMMCKIKFDSSGQMIEVCRGISPNIFKIYENGVEIDKAGKSNLDLKLENLIGIDIETFKSFISLSINDFKNFISLTNEEKKSLLDRLFNLEVINILSQILKEINKTNKSELLKIDSQISTLLESIQSIKISIQKSIQKEKENLDSEISHIQNLILEKKENYTSLKSKVDKLKEKEKEILDILEKEKEAHQTSKTNILQTEKEISLFNNKKCPTCGQSFDTDLHRAMRVELDEKKNKFIAIKSEIEKNIESILQRKRKLEELMTKTVDEFSELGYVLKGYKSNIQTLEQKKSSQKFDTSSTQEFEESLHGLEKSVSQKKDVKTNLSEKEAYYRELDKILSEDGVKKIIISKIVSPINFFLDENLKKMSVPYSVVLDQNFDASIYLSGVKIEQDSLSTGENKRINIAIMIAYLKMIRTKRSINILFLDEIFASIDPDGIDSILTLLKDFSHNYNINIFVVHHAVMKNEIFDRIMMVRKDIFSQIEEIENNQ